MNDACVIALMVVGFVFLGLALLGIHLWQLGRLTIFTGWPDLIVTCASPVVILFLTGFIRSIHLSNHGNEDTSIAEIMLWCVWVLVILIGAWRANNQGWKFWVALPTRILAIALIYLAIAVARELLSRFLNRRGE